MNSEDNLATPTREVSEGTGDASADPLNSIQLSRQRVMTFEKEYKDSIDELEKTEALRKELLELRRTWLTKEGTAVRLDFEATKKQFDILKLKADILSSKVDLDKYTLESYYETQQLKILVEGTKPPDPSDLKGRLREIKLEKIMRDGAESLKRSLTESILFRQEASSESKRLVNMLDNKVKEKLHRDEVINNDADNTLTLFVERARKSLSKCEKNLKLVTGNYLVLRHNSRMATEILTKSRNDIAMQRQDLRDRFVQLLNNIEMKKEEDEEHHKDELEIQIRRQRSEVMKYESELELKWNENEEIRQQKNKNMLDIKKSIKMYKTQYNDLQIRRRRELTTVQGQLTKLREELSLAEEAVFSARRNKHMLTKRVDVRESKNGISTDKGRTRASSTRSRKAKEYCSDDEEILRQLQERMMELRENLKDL